MINNVSEPYRKWCVFRMYSWDWHRSASMMPPYTQSVARLSNMVRHIREEYNGEKRMVKLNGKR